VAVIVIDHVAVFEHVAGHAAVAASIVHQHGHVGGPVPVRGQSHMDRPRSRRRVRPRLGHDHVIAHDHDVAGHVAVSFRPRDEVSA
jgi:hypothetical protein